MTGDTHELDAASVRSIVEHMNADHADALVACARALGGRGPDVEARMTGIDRRGIDLDCRDAAGHARVRLDFPEPLADARDARRALVAMTRAARAALD